MVSIADAFASAHRRMVRSDPDSEFLPKYLAAACVQALPVAGATVSLFNDTGMPFPVSVSDRDAATAESLQFTTANGPCLEAWTIQKPVVADQMSLAGRWPLFYDELVTSTPFLAMVCVPLGHGLGQTGTLNLLLLSDAQFSGLRLADVAVANDLISQALLVSLTPTASASNCQPVQPWSTGINNPQDSPREAVAHAVMMLADALGLTKVDALAVLRARAFATGRSADDVAADVVGLMLTVRHLALDEDLERGV